MKKYLLLSLLFFSVSALSQVTQWQTFYNVPGMPNPTEGLLLNV